MSLVYNNKKLIGKCSKFAIEKVQGTSPFVMLENFEPKQPQLNENQQIVLDWLKKKCDSKDDFMGWYPFEAIMHLSVGLDPGELRIVPSIQELTYKQEIEVLQVFSQWALEREEE